MPGCPVYQKHQRSLIMHKLITRYAMKYLVDAFDEDLLIFYGRDKIFLKNKHTFFISKLFAELNN